MSKKKRLTREFWPPVIPPATPPPATTVIDHTQIVITRASPNMDDACEAAHLQAIAYFNAKPNGGVKVQTDRGLRNCWVETRFETYTRRRDQHVYTFVAEVLRKS